MACGAYIHIPFCKQKCYYCDFPSYGGVEKYIPAYVKALCTEMRHSAFAHSLLDTIYIGGGTPSILTPGQLESILATVRNTFTVTNTAEVTLEVNPQSVNSSYYPALLAIGINRLSFGVQSFQDGELNRIGRTHTAQEAEQSIRAAYAAGISNISADLIYGLPGQQVRDFEKNVITANTLPLQHISAYGLQLEEGTQFWQWQHQGKLTLPTDPENEAMYDLLCQRLQSAGFEHYEISNFARPGYRSRHNMKYWQYDDYIGFGASAHSFVNGKRYAAVANIPRYIQAAGTIDGTVVENIVIMPERAVEDYCFLALRTSDGISYESFRNRFGYEITDIFGTVIDKLLQEKLLQRTPAGVCLSNIGVKYGNYVFGEFIRPST